MIDHWTELLSPAGVQWQGGRVWNFGDPAAERRALDGEAILVPITDLSVWQVSGADAPSFLQAQTTNDLVALQPGHWQRSGYCNPKGRLLATLLIAQTAPQDFVALLPASLAEAVFARLSRYVLRAKVKLAVMPFAVLGLAGPKAAQKLTGAQFPCPAPGQLASAKTGWVLGLSAERFLILAPAEALPAVWSELAAVSRPAGEPLWDALDIAAGLATVLPPTQEAFVPQMLNFDLVAGLSYTKGCYPGQEIVARMHYLGRLKERLYRARAVGPQPNPGDKLFSPAFGDQACGTVVLATPGEAAAAEFLAVLQIGAVTNGEVHLGAPDGPRLHFLPLPYAVPEAPVAST